MLNVESGIAGDIRVGIYLPTRPKPFNLSYRLERVALYIALEWKFYKIRYKSLKV